VGHALENDFKALKLLHGNVIDTVILFPHPRGLPYRSALRILVQRYALERNLVFYLEVNSCR
jgi:RNA exonuclease 1